MPVAQAGASLQQAQLSHPPPSNRPPPQQEPRPLTADARQVRRRIAGSRDPIASGSSTSTPPQQHRLLYTGIGIEPRRRRKNTTKKERLDKENAQALAAVAASRSGPAPPGFVPRLSVPREAYCPSDSIHLITNGTTYTFLTMEAAAKPRSKRNKMHPPYYIPKEPHRTVPGLIPLPATRATNR